MKNLFFEAADDEALTLGEAWRPKNLKAGSLWKAPEPQFGKTRADAETLIEAYQTEQLNKGREEVQQHG